jgi:hypothetical protein
MPARGAVSSHGESFLRVEPRCDQWMKLLNRRPEGTFAGKTLAEWRAHSRRELGLDESRPIIATGHQTLLWHPGILAKYLVTEAMAKQHHLATANLVVDQHAEGFGDFEIPLKRGDDSQFVRRIELYPPGARPRPRPRNDVPMAFHRAFTPPRPPENLDGALPSVRDGVRDIFEAVYSHRNAANAAMQMAGALADLMNPWVRPMVDVTSTALIHTRLAQAIMDEMVRDPTACVESYNRAVRSFPEAGIQPLLIRDDYVELPLWRIREDGRRMHAYDSDVEDRLEARHQGIEASRHQGDESSIVNRQSSMTLMPRALFMTALVRLAMCDLFIHGTGGANYDRAMERWIKDWLGIDVGSIAVATADVRLPLTDDKDQIDVHAARMEARRLWHDPDSNEHSTHPSVPKRELLRVIEAAPRHSLARSSAFVTMHERLARLRAAHAEAITQSQQAVREAQRHAANLAIAQRRDWAFPLYPREMIDELNAEARLVAGCAQ